MSTRGSQLALVAKKESLKAALASGVTSYFGGDNARVLEALVAYGIVIDGA